MRQDLNRMLERLGSQKLPERLGRLETDLTRRMRPPRALAATPVWRSAAIGLALVAGVGVGGSAAALNGNRPQAHDVLNGARLAPSTLLSSAE